MAGHRPGPFFLRFHGPRRSRVYENTKKELGQHPAILTEQAWSTKDLLYLYSENIPLCFNKRINDKSQERKLNLFAAK